MTELEDEILQEMRTMSTAVKDLRNDLSKNYEMLVNAVVAQDRVPVSVLTNIASSFAKERRIWIAIVATLIGVIVGIKFFAPHLLGAG